MPLFRLAVDPGFVALARLLAAIAIGTASLPVKAAELPDGTWSIQAENDRIARTDRHYTHGHRIAWMSDKTTAGPQWMRDTLESLYPLAEVRGGRIGFALGQSIYTPEDVNARRLVTDDRPYAGWLYGAVSLHAETTRDEAGVMFDTLDSVELNLGVVGPAALGEEVQNGFHEIIDVSKSKGWDNQLDNEPVVALFFQRKWRPEAYPVGGIEADFIPHIGGAVGNVFTLGNAGVTVRIGEGLGVDYGPPAIRPTMTGLTAVEPGPGFGWYVFGAVEGRAVGRNIFLDGNTFADSHSVDKKNLVGEFQLGLAIRYRDARLTFTHVFRTPEFDGQPEPDRFGAVTLSFRF